jgi:hypothetical protein
MEPDKTLWAVLQEAGRVPRGPGFRVKVQGLRSRV